MGKTYTRDFVKSMKAAQRAAQIEAGLRSMPNLCTREIVSKRDKARDPKRMRKTFNWRNEE